MADAGADGSEAAGPGDGMKVSERKKQKELDQQRKRQALELLSDDTYDIIVRQFNRVLQNLSAQEGMEKFRAEYEILYKALTRAHESEVRLLAKCADLNGEIAANATKVESAIQMSLNDQEVIENLKKELETAHLLVEDAREKEIRARATTISIRQSFKSLVKIIEGNANALPENNAMELMRMKEELAEQLEARTLELGDLKSQFELLNAQHDALEKYYTEAQNKIRHLEVEIETRDNEGQREQRKREKLDRELRQAKSEIESKNQENRNLRSTIENLNRDNTNQEYQIREIKQTLEKQQKEMNQIQEMNRKIQAEFNNQESLCANLMGDNHAKTMEIKLREDEINGLRNEIQKYEKNKFTLNRKIRAMEDQKMQMDKQRETMRTEMGTIEKALEATRKQVASDKKEIDELIKLRDSSRKSIVKQQEEQESIMQYVLMHEMTIKKLEKEMIEAKEKDQENDKLIYRLHCEKSDKQRQIQKLANKIMKVQQEAHEIGLSRMDLQRRIEDWEKRHKELNSRYEHVRNERNANGKSLFETRDEVLELKKQMAITEHQIDQLREQNSFKDASLSKERLENQRMAKDAETLKVEIMGIKNKLKEAEAEVRFHEQREQRMMRDLDKIENEIMLEKKKTEKVEDERDILGTQLLRRNDELGLLYEKIKCLQAAMHMGEAAYNTRLEDIRILKVEVKKLRCSKIFMEKGLGTLEDMRRELYHQHQETLQIRNRCKALEDELENPMNVHRWRKLEGSDPSLLEIILKVQGMQKKLILKTEEVLKKEQIIKEKDQLFEELSRVLARRAAPEMAEELSACRKTIRNQSNRIKGLTAEVRMHETIAAEMKFKNECLNRDLMKVNDEHKLLKEHVERIDDKDCYVEQIAFGPFPILNRPVPKPPPAPPLSCRSVNSQRNVRTAAQ